MKKPVVFIFMMVVLLSFVNAESIGDKYEVNESMDITNYCEAGVCTYATMVSIEYPNGTIIYPNINMTANGQTYNYTFVPPISGKYDFVTCGDSTINVCDKDSFNVNYNGQEVFIGVHIILLIFFVFLFYGFHKLNSNVNFDQWYSKTLNKYRGKNYFNAVGGTVAYFFIRNVFAVYYVLGLLVLLVVTDMVLAYNVVSLVATMETVSFIYTLGSIGIVFGLLGMMQQFIVGIMDDLKKMSWGTLNGKK